MPDEKEYLSREKYDELTKELDHLRSTARREVLVELEDAKKLGDLSENAEYHEARKKQADLEERVMMLEQLLKNAEIVSHKKSDTVSMGSTVIIKKEDADARKYEIVGTEEADGALGKLSNKSPIGEALIGKKKGDKISIKTPGGGHVVYEIAEVK
ncbi:transcription elongation factor GreA [bacterium]|nr:transcription elongation factor GreA [bacterium]